MSNVKFLIIYLGAKDLGTNLTILIIMISALSYKYSDQFDIHSISAFAVSLKGYKINALQHYMTKRRI